MIMVPAPIGQPAGRGWPIDRTMVIAAGLCCIGMTMAAGMVWGLDAKRQERAVEIANEAVAGKVAAARLLMAQRDWSPAIALLEDALVTERATERTAAESLLAEAREGVADDRALAQRRRDEERAEALRRAAEKQAEAERRRAEDARRRAESELRQREVRVRATPLFQELFAFIQQTEARHREWQNDGLFVYLFRELGIKDAAEQQKVRDDLRRHDVTQILEHSVGNMRARVMAELPSLASLDQKDRELFLSIADRELDQLLEQLTR
jgi:hypothetical protein